MTPDEQRQAVVFHARFEFFDQMFAVPGHRAERGSTFDSLQTNGQPVPERWRNFPVLDAQRVAELWRLVVPEPWHGPYPKHWCACLAHYCTIAGLGLTTRARLRKPENWLEFEQALGLRQLERGELPKPGDWAYFERNQHRAIVQEVDATARTFDSIDGNQPAICMYKGRALSSVKAFWSLEPLLNGAA